MDEIKELLIKKFVEIKERILMVVDQLDDQELNWKPNEMSNSIANLIVHINANISERIGKGMRHQEFTRDRNAEFEKLYRSKTELIEMINQSFDETIETLATMNEDQLKNTQIVRNRERTHLDMFIQCATHFSEHMGQILYIGKILKNNDYRSTSIPKGK